MAIRILHAGDLHIGSFPGPEVNGENARYRDICKCLDALVAGAEAAQPDMAVIAGDVFHQARVWSDRGLKENQTAVRFLRRLASVCPVVVMRGTPNHDSEEQFNMLEVAFEGDDSVSIVTSPGVRTYRSYTGKRVQIACLPGFDRGYYRAQHPGLSKEEENDVFTKAIEDMIIGLKAQCDKESPAVLVSHYTITGCNMESGQTAFFSQFEPVVYPQTLQAAGYDLVCFGHIHRPQQLDGCRNTFYCGAISALNFNDEGQERGYYIHTIEDGGQVASEFFNLPTRQYQTIRLRDEDIAEIIGGALDISPEKLPDVKDKVVRVLYDCTDEHNKAFNHAVYENMLYAAGAFWVQEITPQKITITVDRRSMEAGDTPEDNLTAYLAEKELAPEKIGELVELARPIISEATEKATTERRTGLFVPVEIEVRNYRNYREETFSFADVQFCTINGENGVGKSSLFMDAMADALFEEPREGDLTGWICNDPDARSGAIKFTFKLGESLYRVTRTRQKSGKATLNISELVDGEWADRSKEKYKDTQAEIINIIGMDSLTFKACALIMQDQYGLFLQADKEARMNILGNILGLVIYTVMEDMTAERLTDANRKIRSLADKVEVITAGLPDRQELQEEIDRAAIRIEELKAAEQTMTAGVDSLKVALNTQLEAAERAMKINSRISTLVLNRATKQSAKTAQTAILAGAEAVLAAEPAVLAGVQHYNELVEREKEEIKAKATYDSLVARKDRLNERLRKAESEAAEASRKKAALTLAKIGPLQQTLAREQELAGKHAEYEAVKQQAAELEALAPVWKEKQATVQEAAKKVDELVRAREEEHRKCSDRYDVLRQKVALLADSGCPDVENAHCRFLADALAAKEELPEVEAKLNEYRTETSDTILDAQSVLTAARKELDEVLYTPERYEAICADLRALEPYEKEYGDLESVRNELKIITERQQELEQQAAEQTAEAERVKKELVDVTVQITGVEEANAMYEKLKADIDGSRIWLEKEKQLPVEREKKAAALARIAELETELGAIETEITESKAEQEKELTAAAGKEELQRQVDEAETKIHMVQAEAQELSMKLGGLKQRQEQAQEKLKQAAALQEQINAASVQAAGYDELKKAFSQDGIPHNIIRSIIPIFEATATNILGQMSGGKMSVEFVTEKVLKSNNKKEVTTLDIIINDCDTGRLPYMSRSGGERVKAALSVILALSEIKSSKAGVQLGFLFIDEPPFLDAQGVQAYCDALEAIQRRYGSLKIMAITHDPAMKSRFPQSVDVVKTPEGSKVIYE